MYSQKNLQHWIHITNKKYVDKIISFHDISTYKMSFFYRTDPNNVRYYTEKEELIPLHASSLDDRDTYVKFENVILLSNVPGVQRNLYTIKFNLQCMKADGTTVTAYTNIDLKLRSTNYVFYTDYYLYPLHREVRLRDLFP